MIDRRQFSKMLLMSGLAAGLSDRTAFASAAPVRVLVGFAAGGTADNVARAVLDGMRTSGFNGIVVNKPGASGRLAMESMLASPADGETLLFVPSTNLSLFPQIYSNLRYSLNDIETVGVAAEVQFGLAVNAEKGPRSLSEFLGRAKKDPANGFFGVPGSGSIMQLLGDVLSKRSGVQLTSVPYKGGSAAMADTVGNVVPAVLTALPNLLPMHQSGKLRILAVSSDKPLAGLPNVPTFASLGYPQLTASEYMCLVGKRPLPAQYVTKTNESLNAAAQSHKVLSTLERLGFQRAASLKPNELRGRLTSDASRWAVAVKETGFRPVE